MIRTLSMCSWTARLCALISTVQAPKKTCRSEDRFEAHAPGRSKGGLSTKIDAATDALGNPIRFVLTGGQRNDITQIEPLLDGLKAGHVLADTEHRAVPGAREDAQAMTVNAPWMPSLPQAQNLSSRAAQPQPNGAALMPRSIRIAI
jgi:transposase